MPRHVLMVFMKRILTIILSFTTIFLGFTAQGEELTLPHGDFELMRQTGGGTVSEVVNPLTVKLEDGRLVDLAGLDYPDLDFYDPGDLAVTAQEILNDFLKGQKVTIYQTATTAKGRVNRMNHHIAHLVRNKDGVWVQGMLLSLGVARVRTTKYNPEMATQMLALENKARQEKAGLWAMEKYAILTPEQAKEHIGSYQVVEGVVNSVSMHRNKLYLNFGHNWKDDFTIGISAFDERDFKQHKFEPRRWSGKKIRVRGWVESYNGPYIEIDHPERVETLFEQSDGDNNDAPKGSALPDRVAAPDKASNREKNSGNALPKLND